MNRRNRVAVALAIGLACGLATWLVTLNPRYYAQDFDVWWRAARLLRDGHDPYRELLGKDGVIKGVRIFFYPLVSALTVWPLSFIDYAQAAAGIFMGVSCAVLAYAVTATAWWPLLLFVSGSMVNCLLAAQWAPLITAAIFLPGLAWLGMLKPNLGLAVLAHRWSWRAVLIMIAIGVASLIVMPRWPIEWIQNAVQSPFHVSAITAPGGAILALALIRWRRPEARLLLVLAVLPTTPSLCDTLPLFAIPQSRVESTTLAVVTLIGMAWLAQRSFVNDPSYLGDARKAILWLAYVPALAMVLRRPNSA